MPDAVILSEVIAAPGPIEIGGLPQSSYPIQPGPYTQGNWYMYPPNPQFCNLETVKTCTSAVGQAWGDTPYGNHLAQQICLSRLCASRPVRSGTLVQTRGIGR